MTEFADFFSFVHKYLVWENLFDEHGYFGTLLSNKSITVDYKFFAPNRDKWKSQIDRGETGKLLVSM